MDSGRLKVEEEIDGVVQIYYYAPGDILSNPPGKKHRVEALEDACLFEVSTPQLDDVVRVEDDYGR